MQRKSRLIIWRRNSWKKKTYTEHWKEHLQDPWVVFHVYLHISVQMYTINLLPTSAFMQLDHLMFVWVCHFCFFSFFQISELLAEVAVLEEEVARLEEQVACFREKLLLYQEETKTTSIPSSSSSKKKKKMKEKVSLISMPANSTWPHWIEKIELWFMFGFYLLLALRAGGIQSSSDQVLIFFSLNFTQRASWLWCGTWFLMKYLVLLNVFSNYVIGYKLQNLLSFIYKLWYKKIK